MNESSSLCELRREITQTRSTLLVLLAFVQLFLLICNLLAIVSILRATKTYEDVLGSRDKLPDLTKFVVGYGSVNSGSFATALVVIGVVVSWGSMIAFRRTSRSLWAAVISVILLLAHWGIVTIALKLPMVPIRFGFPT